VNEICDALASAAARGTPGPAAGDVFAALRAERLLGEGDAPRVASAGWGAAQAEPRRRGQLDLGF
jgi:hypothetical protein